MRIACHRAALATFAVGFFGSPTWLFWGHIHPLVAYASLFVAVAVVACSALAGRLWMRRAPRTSAAGVIALLASRDPADRQAGLRAAADFFREAPLSRHRRMAVLARQDRG